MEVDTQKRQPDIENENKKAQEMRKEALHPALYSKYNLYLSPRYCNIRF